MSAVEAVLGEGGNLFEGGGGFFEGGGLLGSALGEGLAGLGDLVGGGGELLGAALDAAADGAQALVGRADEEEAEEGAGEDAADDGENDEPGISLCLLFGIRGILSDPSLEGVGQGLYGVEVLFGGGGELFDGHRVGGFVLFGAADFDDLVADFGVFLAQLEGVFDGLDGGGVGECFSEALEVLGVTGAVVFDLLLDAGDVGFVVAADMAEYQAIVGGGVHLDLVAGEGGGDVEGGELVHSRGDLSEGDDTNNTADCGEDAHDGECRGDAHTKGPFFHS